MARRLVCVALAAIALAALTGSATIAAAPARPTVPNPTVYGPIGGGIHGYPWNHSLFRLRGGRYDYTEKEYFLAGTATDLSTGAQAPYESRMLVRLPRDRHDFSGIVTVEWLNVTGQSDLETSWPVEGKYLMRHGIGFVGVSAQLAGVCWLDLAVPQRPICHDSPPDRYRSRPRHPRRR